MCLATEHLLCNRHLLDGAEVHVLCNMQTDRPEENRSKKLSDECDNR